MVHVTGYSTTAWRLWTTLQIGLISRPGNSISRSNWLAGNLWHIPSWSTSCHLLASATWHQFLFYQHTNFGDFDIHSIAIYSYNKSQWDALFLKFILIKNSTLYRQNLLHFSECFTVLPSLHNTEFYLQHVLQFKCNLHVHTWAR